MKTQPHSIPGVAEGPKFDGETIQAIVIQVTNFRAYVPVQTGVALLKSVFQFTPENRRKDFFNERWLGLLAGTDRLQKSIGEGEALDLVVSSWQGEIETFSIKRNKYLLYD